MGIERGQVIGIQIVPVVLENRALEKDFTFWVRKSHFVMYLVDGKKVMGDSGLYCRRLEIGNLYAALLRTGFSLRAV